MPHQLVLMCGGSSERFPGMAPKWSLRHPNRNMMFVEALRGVVPKHKGSSAKYEVFIVVRDKHLESLSMGTEDFRDALRGYVSRQCSRIHLTTIPETTSQVASAMHVKGFLQMHEPVTFRDCDNSIQYAFGYNNEISVCELQDVEYIKPNSKSYVVHRDGAAFAVREKQVISTTFCTGAYTWSSAGKFWDAVDARMRYMSEVVNRSISNGEDFKIVRSPIYIDWGTLEDWQRYIGRYEATTQSVVVKGSASAG